MLVVLVSSVFLFSGCAGMSDSDTTRAQGAGAGAAGGAVIGALLGQAIGNDTESTMLGAAIGASIGGLGGYAYGDHVARQKEKYASTEDWLDACIASAEQTNNEVQAYNAQLAGEIQQFKNEVAALKAQHQKKQQNQEALLAKKAEIDAALAKAQEQLKKAQQELESQRYAVAEVQDLEGGAAGDNAAILDQKIAQLEESIAQLQNHTTSLAAASNSIAV